MGLLSIIAEQARSTLTQDSKFWRQMLYYFELRVPAHLTDGNAQPYLYPLILPPESYSMSEPFAVDRSFTNGGGLFVEEQGIIAREITLSGTTGFAPRRHNLRAGLSQVGRVRMPKNRTFSRNTTGGSVQQVAPLSGQRHFQFLQDTVFRTYADLKQDPATSEGTELYFHIVRDDEHWRVIPLSFQMRRDASRPVEYQYTIQLLAVQKASDSQNATLEDFPVVKALQNVNASLRVAVTAARAALQDLAQVQGQMRALNSKFSGLLTEGTSVVDATADLLDGNARLIKAPFTTVNNAIDDGLAALESVNAALEANQLAVESVPANFLNTTRKLLDALAIIGSYPAQFQNSLQEAVNRFQRQMELITSRQTATLSAAASQQSPSTIRAFGLMGSASMPGDYARSQDSLGLGRSVPKFLSAVEYIIEQGDSLEALAARYLGDARFWKYIAIFNDLRPPFISAEGLPGTRDVGDTILIPSLSEPPTVQTNPATFGVRPDDSAAVHALGRDLKTSDNGEGFYDLEVAVEGGSVDVRTVEGVPNLQQGIRTRIITERGTDLLYRQLGTARVVGLGLSLIDFEMAQFRLIESVQADPRIAGVRNVVFETPQADTLVATIDAEVRGFTRPERITVVAAV